MRVVPAYVVEEWDMEPRRSMLAGKPVGLMLGRNGSLRPLYGYTDGSFGYTRPAYGLWTKGIGNFLRKIGDELKAGGGPRGSWTRSDYERERKRLRRALAASKKKIQGLARKLQATEGEVVTLQQQLRLARSAAAPRPRPMPRARVRDEYDDGYDDGYDDEHDDYFGRKPGRPKHKRPLARRRGWTTSQAPGSPRLRFQTAPGFRIGVIGLGNGMWLVAEISEAVLADATPEQVSGAMEGQAVAAIQGGRGAFGHWTAALPQPVRAGLLPMPAAEGESGGDLY